MTGTVSEYICTPRSSESFMVSSLFAPASCSIQRPALSHPRHNFSEANISISLRLFSPLDLLRQAIDLPPNILRELSIPRLWHHLLSAPIPRRYGRPRCRHSCSGRAKGASRRCPKSETTTGWCRGLPKQRSSRSRGRSRTKGKPGRCGGRRAEDTASCWCWCRRCRGGGTKTCPETRRGWSGSGRWRTKPSAKS